MTELKIAIATVCGFLSYALGFNDYVAMLLWCISLDLIVGILSCFINPRMKFNSTRLYRGICKKVVMLAIVTFSHQFDVLMHTTMICDCVTLYLVANEGLSIVENAGKCGVPIPPIISKSLEQLKGVKK